MSDETLPLLEALPAPSFGTYLLNNLPPDDRLVGPEPDAALVRSIKELGRLLQPVILRYPGKGQACHEVIDGRRRIKAARKAGLESIDVVIYPDSVNHSDLISLIANQTRKDNLVSDMVAIESLVQKGYAKADIAKAVGMTITQLEKKLRLTNLHPVLKALLQEGAMSPGTAQAAAKVSIDLQQKAVDQWKEERLKAQSTKVVPFTMDILKGVKQVGATESFESLDDRMFEASGLERQEDHRVQVSEEAYRGLQFLLERFDGNTAEELVSLLILKTATKHGYDQALAA